MRSPLFFKLFPPPPPYNVPFSLVSFSASPYLWFSSVWLWFCLHFLFFGTDLFWGFLNFPNCVFMSFIGFGKYISFCYFFLYLLLLQSFSFFSWNSNYPYVSLLKMVLQVLNVCFFILSFFSFAFLRLHYFHCPIFKFTDIFFCLLTFAFETL